MKKLIPGVVIVLALVALGIWLIPPMIESTERREKNEAQWKVPHHLKGGNFQLADELMKEHEFAPEVVREMCEEALLAEIYKQCSTTTESRPLATKLMRFCHIDDEQFVGLVDKVAEQRFHEDPMVSWYIRQGCSRKSVGWPPTHNESRVAFEWAVENGMGAQALDIAQAYHIFSTEEKAKAAERWAVVLLIPRECSLYNVSNYSIPNCAKKNKDDKAQAFKLIEEYDLNVGRIVQMLPLVRAVGDVGFAYRLVNLATPLDVAQSH